jgi:hypothetical protein
MQSIFFLPVCTFSNVTSYPASDDTVAPQPDAPG